MEDERLHLFDEYELDMARGCLLRSGRPVHLRPQAYKALKYLAENSGRLVSKDQLIEEVWEGRAVTDDSLVQCLRDVRQALGEGGNHYLRTERGRGYIFDLEAGGLERSGSSQVWTEQVDLLKVVIEEEEVTGQTDADNQMASGPEGRLASGVAAQAKPVAYTSASDKSAFNEGRPHKRRALLIAVGLVITIAVAAIAYFTSSEGRPQPFTSIAVLPFATEGADENTQYLSDGITESLINSLSQLSQLKIVARGAAFRYKGKDPDAQTIGRDLRVDAIITGKVSQQGDTLVVQAELLNTADGSQVWGARYRRKLSDLFSVQEALAREIADNLRLKLTREDMQVLSNRYTENLRAYQSYLLGWSYLHRGTREDLSAAIGHFERAIQEEPNYALAHCALTEAYVSMTIRGLIEPVEGRRKAEESARTALALDPDLAEAHAALGQTRIFFAPFDFYTGDHELRRAIQTNPNLTVAHILLAASLLQQGRLDESIDEWQRARELDPLSIKTVRLLAFTHLLKRDYSKAMELLKESYDLGPPFIIWGEVEFFIQSGKLTEALAALQEAKHDRKDNPIVITSEGMVYAAQRKTDEALRVIKELEQRHDLGPSRAGWIARIYATLKEKELAISWLERGFETGMIPHFFKDAPVWDELRDEPRFRELLRRMGIPQ